MSLALFQALDRLDSHWSGPVDIERRFGGETNRLFRLDTDEGAMALRLNRDNPAQLGLDRAREQAVLQVIEGQPFAPGILAQDADLLLTRWVEGKPPANGEETDVGALAATLEQVHAAPLPDYSLNIADQITHLLDYGPALESAVADALGARCEGYALPDRLTLCHHDWHPGNILATPTGWVLLDWEFAAAGDPAMDVAAAVSGFGLSPSQGAALSERLAIGPERFRQALCLMEAVAWVWYRALDAESAPDGWAWLERWGSGGLE